MSTSLLSPLGALGQQPDFYFYAAPHVRFFGPIPLHRWRPTYTSGVYAIVEPFGSAGEFRVLYVGKANTFAERGFPDRHEHYADWVRAAGYASRLYVVYRYVASETNRVSLEQDLIRQLRPPCNKQHNTLGQALRRLVSEPAIPARPAPRFPFS